MVRIEIRIKLTLRQDKDITLTMSQMENFLFFALSPNFTKI